jgi:hypothetical protein
MVSTKILTFLTSFLIIVSYLSAMDQESIQQKNPDRVVGKLQSLTPNSMTVRVGDATTTFSFDNKTVFTYGDKRGNFSDLKVGDEVFAKVKKGKAAEVNGTEKIEGIIEQVDSAKKQLIVKVGDQLKKIPFHYFTAFSSEGKTASYEEMKAGDSVLLNVNVGFANQPQSPTVEKP